MARTIGSFVGVSKQTEMLLMTVMALCVNSFDMAIFEISSNLEQVWSIDMDPAMFRAKVEYVMRMLLSGVVCIRTFTLHLYIAFLIAVFWPVCCETRPTLMLPWLIVSAIKNLGTGLVSLATGVYTCVIYGPLRPACLRFIALQIVDLSPSFYMWFVGLSLYRDLKKPKPINKNIIKAMEEQELDVALRRRKVKSMINEDILRQQVESRSCNKKSLGINTVEVNEIYNPASYDNLKINCSRSLDSLLDVLIARTEIMEIKAAEEAAETLDIPEELSLKEKTAKLLGISISEIDNMKRNRRTHQDSPMYCLYAQKKTTHISNNILYYESPAKLLPKTSLYSPSVKPIRPTKSELRSPKDFLILNTPTDFITEKEVRTIELSKDENFDSSSSNHVMFQETNSEIKGVENGTVVLQTTETKICCSKEKLNKDEIINDEKDNCELQNMLNKNSYHLNYDKKKSISSKSSSNDSMKQEILENSLMEQENITLLQKKSDSKLGVKKEILTKKIKDQNVILIGKSSFKTKNINQEIKEEKLQNMKATYTKIKLKRETLLGNSKKFTNLYNSVLTKTGPGNQSSSNESLTDDTQNLAENSINSIISTAASCDKNSSQESIIKETQNLAEISNNSVVAAVTSSKTNINRDNICENSPNFEKNINNTTHANAASSKTKIKSSKTNLNQGSLLEETQNTAQNLISPLSSKATSSKTSINSNTIIAEATSCTSSLNQGSLSDEIQNTSQNSTTRSTKHIQGRVRAKSQNSERNSNIFMLVNATLNKINTDKGRIRGKSQNSERNLKNSIPFKDIFKTNQSQGKGNENLENAERNTDDSKIVKATSSNTNIDQNNSVIAKATSSKTNMNEKSLPENSRNLNHGSVCVNSQNLETNVNKAYVPGKLQTSEQMSSDAEINQGSLFGKYQNSDSIISATTLSDDLLLSVASVEENENNSLYSKTSTSKESVSQENEQNNNIPPICGPSLKKANSSDNKNENISKLERKSSNQQTLISPETLSTKISNQSFNDDLLKKVQRNKTLCKYLTCIPPLDLKNANPVKTCCFNLSASNNSRGLNDMSCQASTLGKKVLDVNPTAVCRKSSKLSCEQLSARSRSNDAKGLQAKVSYQRLCNQKLAHLKAYNEDPILNFTNRHTSPVSTPRTPCAPRTPRSDIKSQKSYMNIHRGRLDLNKSLQEVDKFECKTSSTLLEDGYSRLFNLLGVNNEVDSNKSNNRLKIESTLKF